MIDNINLHYVKRSWLTVALLLVAVGIGAQEVASATAVTPEQGIVLPAEIKFVLMTLGGGGLAGWAVGFTLKKVAKLAALVLGIGFISMQYLAFNRYITIDWERIKTTVPNDRLEQSASGLVSTLTYNLPFAGSFAVGLWMGFRKG